MAHLLAPVGVGSGLEQHADDLDVAGVGRLPERRRANLQRIAACCVPRASRAVFLEHRLQLGVRVQQRADDRSMPVRSGEQKRPREAVRLPRLGRHAICEQRLDRAHFAMCSGIDESLLAHVPRLLFNHAKIGLRRHDLLHEPLACPPKAQVRAPRGSVPHLIQLQSLRPVDHTRHGRVARLHGLLAHGEHLSAWSRREEHQRVCPDVEEPACQGGVALEGIHMERRQASQSGLVFDTCARGEEHIHDAPIRLCVKHRTEPREAAHVLLVVASFDRPEELQRGVHECARDFAGLAALCDVHRRDDDLLFLLFRAQPSYPAWIAQVGLVGLASVRADKVETKGEQVRLHLVDFLACGCCLHPQRTASLAPGRGV
eukprot:5572403-Prymnesium_polylepis.2